MPSSVLDYPFDYVHVTEDTQIATSNGTLHTITINRGDAEAGAIVTVYDSADAGATGDVIAIIAMDTAVYVIPQTLTYDVKLVYGLYIDFFAGMTTGDLTVSYR